MKKSWFIDRRTMLRGVGVALALPFLEVMAADTPGAPKGHNGPPIRAAFLYTPNGAYMPSFTPKGESLSSPILDVIERHRADFNVLTGLCIANSNHQMGPPRWLTGCEPVGGKALKLKESDAISIDQYIARCVGSQTFLDTLTLGLQPIDTSVNNVKSNTELNHAYQHSISWKNSSTLATKQISPLAVFDSMFRTRQPRVPRFGTVTSPAPKETGGTTRDLAESRQKSVLDLAREATKRLEAGVGYEDKQKIEQYLESVGSLEKRLAFAELDSGIDDTKTIRKSGTSSGLMQVGRPKDMTVDKKQVNCREFWKVMLDMIALAFQTDTTRSATFMYTNEGAGGSIAYASEGFKDSHHTLSHHGKKEEDSKVKDIIKINRMQIEMYGHFLDRLKSVQENGKPLLDNCLILQGSSLANADNHTGNGLPIVLAGKAGGKIKTGRHLIFDKRDLFWSRDSDSGIPFSNALVTINNLMGLPERKFGNSTGALPL